MVKVINWGVRNRHPKGEEGGGGGGSGGDGLIEKRGLANVLAVPMKMKTMSLLMDLILSTLIDSRRVVR